MATIGVVVLSLGGMRALTTCLESVGWADSILILHIGSGNPDFQSTTKCLAEVRHLTFLEEIRSLESELRTDWILCLWGEERVGLELQKELKELRDGPDHYQKSSYRIPVRSRVLNRWVTGSSWGPTPSVRLALGKGEPSLGWWDAWGHGQDKKLGKLGGFIEDYSLDELSRGIGLLNDVSQLWAHRLIEQSWNLRSWNVAWNCLCIFSRILLKNNCALHSLSALALSTFAAYGCLLTGAKVWEGTRLSKEEIRKT